MPLGCNATTLPLSRKNRTIRDNYLSAAKGHDEGQSAGVRASLFSRTWQQVPWRRQWVAEVRTQWTIHLPRCHQTPFCRTNAVGQRLKTNEYFWHIVGTFSFKFGYFVRLGEIVWKNRTVFNELHLHATETKRGDRSKVTSWVLTDARRDVDVALEL